MKTGPDVSSSFTPSGSAPAELAWRPSLTAAALAIEDPLVSEEDVSLETLESLNHALEQAPERADLWMLRFQALKALQLAPEFALRLREAWSDPGLRRRLDAVALRAMWNGLAPGEALPDNVHLPEAESDAAHDEMSCWGGFTLPTTCRFAELAMRTCGEELTALGIAYRSLREQPGFLQNYARSVGPLLNRPSPLQLASHLGRHIGGRARIFLKREDLRPSSAEKENALAQVYLAKLLGARCVVAAAEPPAHAIEVASAARHFKLQCVAVLQADESEPRLAESLRALGARVTTTAALQAGTDDVREAALRFWHKAPGRRHLALSLAMGPPPYTTMANDFAALIGLETELQLRAHSTGRPCSFVAAVHSEADALGFILPQIARRDVELVYVDHPQGHESPAFSSRRLAAYNGFRREHAALRALGRCSYVTISDGEAREAQRLAARLENASFGLEDARALAFALLRGQQSTIDRDLVVLAASDPRL